MFQYFRNWLPAKPKVASKETPLLDLPEGVQSQLQQTLASLPSPLPYSEAIREALAEAISVWRQQSEGNNVLVVLGSPIEPLGRIVEQALSDWPALDARSLRILRWSGIPTNPEAFVAGLRKDIREQLKGDTEARETVPLRFSADGVQLDAEPRQQAAIVLPELTQCFVRCIEGLEGVLYLRKEILKRQRSLLDCGLQPLGLGISQLCLSDECLFRSDGCFACIKRVRAVCLVGSGTSPIG